jgi:Na+/H+-dicarboxylate symporter
MPTSLTARILLGMAAGVLLGILIQLANLPDDHLVHVVLVDGVLYVGGRIFIASLMLMVVPLVFVSLVSGASNLGDGASLGRIGGKTLITYLFTTAVAISVALVVALIISPGRGAETGRPVQFDAPEAPPLTEVIINIFPTNPVEAMAEGNMLQIIVFAILFGIALARAGETGQSIKELFQSLNAILMRLIGMLIAVAPIGVFCLMATLFSEVGWQEIFRLGAYFFTVVFVLLIQVSVVYPTLLWSLGRTNPARFLSKMREPMMVAFSTASSGATLPVTLRTVEHRIGVKNEVAAFSIPLGATINMDGTAIMQGVATVFIAQFYLIDLVFTDYLMVILTATLASIGTAAVPGVGLIMLAMVLTQVGLPVEGIMLIIGVDRLLDMMRTAVNVCGDGMVATIVARSEGKFDQAVFDDPDAGRVNHQNPAVVGGRPVDQN